MTTLGEFVETEPPRHRANWVSRLPDDVRQQILDAPQGVHAAQIVRWLKSLGYDDATREKLRPLLEERRG